MKIPDLARDAYNFAKLRAELEHVEGMISSLIWTASSWSEELANARAAWHMFKDEDVDELYLCWVAQIKTGHHVPVQLEGYVQ